MLKIHIITVGNLKEKYLKEGVAEYLKRLSRFANVTLSELSEAYLPQSPAPSDVDKALDKEADAILKRLSGSCRIALCVEGEQLSSEQLSRLIERAEGQGNIDIVIGSSYGLSPRVKRACTHRISFSKMTFPHQLMRLILTEQLYRAFKISHNESYHK